MDQSHIPSFLSFKLLHFPLFPLFYSITLSKRKKTLQPPSPRGFHIFLKNSQYLVLQCSSCVGFFYISLVADFPILKSIANRCLDIAIYLSNRFINFTIVCNNKSEIWIVCCFACYPYPCVEERENSAAESFGMLGTFDTDVTNDHNIINGIS